MTDIFVRHILEKCGIVTVRDFYGKFYYYTNKTDEEITEAEAMELVEEYLVSAVVNRLETGKVN